METMTMFTILIAPILALLFGLCMLTYIGKNNGGKNAKLPPGDLDWPVVGSTFSFFKPHSPTVLGDFIQHQLSKYGKIFTTNFLGKTTIVSADPDLNKFVLQNEMRLFENSLPSQVRTLLGVNSLPYLMGEEYKHTKSMLLSFFNSWEIQTIFLDEVQQHADRILSAWRHPNIIYVGEETHKFALDIIAEKAMGMSFDDPEAELLQREFVTFHKGFYAVPIYLPNTLFGKALKARKNIIKIIKKRLDRKRVEKRNAKPTDWMSCILENDPHESMERICNSVITFLFAGLSNTSIAIALAIYFLGTCPKAVQQMREEHQQIVRGRKDKKAKLAWEDYKNLKFCHCVINETLRLGNILPGVWKKATQDVEFKGYVIPKGTIVLASAASMHLDTDAFERPEVFDPWRWLIMNKTNSWMPFGGGVRYCNGSEFARIEIAIFLLRFMCNYDWEPAELDRPISLPPVVFPRELPIRVYPLKSNVSET